MTFGVISACYTNLSVTLTNQREQGILKRFRGTPLPPLGLHGGDRDELRDPGAGARCPHARRRRGPSTVSSSRRTPTGPLRSSSCSARQRFLRAGVAITVIIPNADAAPAIVNGVYLPLMFSSRARSSRFRRARCSPRSPPTSRYGHSCWPVTTRLKPSGPGPSSPRGVARESRNLVRSCARVRHQTLYLVAASARLAGRALLERSHAAWAS